MMQRFGSATGTAVLALAGLVGLGVGGYSLVSGQSVCSVFAMGCDSAAKTTTATNASNTDLGACPLSGAKTVAVADSKDAKESCSEAKSSCDKSSDSEAQVINAAATESGDSCCPLTKAKAVNVADATECSKSEPINVAATAECSKAKTVNAAAKGECNKASTCDKAGAKTINAAATSECSKAKAVNAAASECSKKINVAATGECSKATTVNAAANECSKAQTVNAAAGECGKSSKTTAMVPATWTLGVGGVALPVFQKDCGAVAYDCSETNASNVNLVAAASCGSVQKASLKGECPVSGGAAVVNAADSKSECSKAKTCDKSAESTTVNAAAECSEAKVCPVTGKVINAAATEQKSECSEAKTCDKAAEATTVNAASECKQGQDGCEGDGEGDCCGNCAEATTAKADAASVPAAGE